MMNLPQNGSVVIVDDQPNQALPIITALSKQGIATTWYRGNDPSGIPEQPVQKIRLIFMDLQLVEGDNDPHMISSRVIQLLEHLIPSNNGPYMLVIWSLKDALYGDELKKRLLTLDTHLRPVCTVTLKKVDCIRQKKETGAGDLIEGVLKQLKRAGFDEDELDSVSSAINSNWIVDKDAEFEVLPGAITTIESAIAKELKKAGVFHLFIIWENLIKNSAAQTVGKVSTTLPHDDNWEQNMRDVFRRMGIARVGQNEVTDEELLKESMLTFIQSFTDNLEAEIQQVQLPDYTSKPGEQLLKLNYKGTTLRLVQEDELVRIYHDKVDEKSKEVTTEKLFEGKDVYKIEGSISKCKDVEKQKYGSDLFKVYWSVPPRLNTGLHLEQSPTNVLVPGNIYEVDVSDDNRAKYVETYFFDISEDELSKIRFIELEVSPICDYAQKKWKKSRLISGAIYPASLTKKLRAQNDHLYKAHPVFLLENDYVKMVFDYHLFKSKDQQEIRNRTTLKYRLRRELLLDIIANVSAHVNRPGISFVA